MAEVCSPPRVVTQAQAEGLTGSVSIDLVSGWDLATSDGQERAWRQLEKKDPLVTILSPPCTMFSILQNLNPKFMSSDAGKRLYHVAIKVLRFCMRVAEWRLLSGRFFVFEHPSGVSSWSEACVTKLLEVPGVQLVRDPLVRIRLGGTGQVRFVAEVDGLVDQCAARRGRKALDP